MFLLETKNLDDLVKKKLSFLPYSSSHLVSPHGVGGGGLALLWKQEVELEVLYSNHNIIDTKIEFEGESFFASFVYGDPDKTKRKGIWDQLCTLANSRESSWFLTGDFNEILNNSEKQGGSLRPEGSFGDFRALLSECDLYDVQHTGNPLSWRGKRYLHTVLCRLDRALANCSWFDQFPSARSEYLNFEGSDHRPLASYFSNKHQKKRGLFRFDRNLQNNAEVKKIVELAWKAKHHLTVDQRIARCRRAIIAWSREKHKNTHKIIEQKKKDLEKAMANPATTYELIQDINKDLSTAYMAEESYWKQRSRQLWLNLGDRNTGYFHSTTKQRRAINKIYVLQNTAGEPVFDEEQIAAEISTYFTDLFTSQPGDRTDTVCKALDQTIGKETNQKLIRKPTAKEIKDAVFSIHADKAPGPDGFSASFYQANWPIIGSDVVLEIQQFFKDGILPTSINKTHIRLIPKVNSAKTLPEYRPIALCSVYYKIISKVLSKRLQPVLKELISENQSAFVQGRAISDNVLITHEVLHYLKNSKATKRCSMAVKTDMSKAYDRLEWDFIKAVLERLGFHPQWTRWIMQCVSTVSYSFLLNGTAKGNINPTRGIRQGDPLSPYLFILCSEVLSGLCRKAEIDGNLSGIQVAKGSPRLNHLLFADDTMFFCKTNTKSCKTLLGILRDYESASGQRINCEKSSITFSYKTPHDIRSRVKSVLSIPKEGGLGKYLGLPEHFGRNKKDLFSHIVDRIRQKAVNWSSKFLSQAGKMILLKAVLASMPTYTMSCFKLPAGLCKRIQSALTRFWWDKNIDQKSICWISWEKLTRSKQHGGLGFRDIQSFNDALLAKLSWRILTNPDCLLARILLGKYCKYQPFLESSTPTTASHGWRGIMIGKDLLRKKLGKIIGDGRTTRVWNDPWLSLNEPIRPVGPPNRHDAALLVKDLLLPESMDWDQKKIETILPGYKSDILNIKPSLTGANDAFAWLGLSSGIYSVRSGYYVAKEMAFPSNDHHQPTINWNSIIWNTKISQKLKLFLWKMVSRALPVGENLTARGVLEQPLCAYCGEPESCLHLFFLCKFAKKVWSLAPFTEPFTPSALSDITAALTTSLTQTCLPPIGISEGPLLPWILWTIWTTRNNKIFNDRAISEEET